MAVQTQEPGPVKRAPEWAGEEEMRMDVSSMTDRAVAVLSLDKGLRMVRALGRLTDRLENFLEADMQSKIILMREMPGFEKRITALEVDRDRWRKARTVEGHPPKPASKPGGKPAEADDEDAFRPEESSYHTIEDIMTQSAAVLYHRMKDPRDQMNSDRVRQITEQFFETAKNAEDAETFRTIKKGTKEIVFTATKTAAKWIVVAALGFAAAHWGLHRGEMPSQERAAPASAPAQGSK